MLVNLTVLSNAEGHEEVTLATVYTSGDYKYGIDRNDYSLCRITRYIGTDEDTEGQSSGLIEGIECSGIELEGGNVIVAKRNDYISGKSSLLK